MARHRAPEARDPRIRHRIGVVDGPRLLGVAELHARRALVRERPCHRLRALVMRVVEHRYRDRLRCLARVEGERVARVRVVLSRARGSVRGPIFDRHRRGERPAQRHREVEHRARVLVDLSASATESVAGPAIVACSPLPGIRPSDVQIPGVPARSVVARSANVTSPKPEGSIRSPQPAQCAIFRFRAIQRQDAHCQPVWRAIHYCFDPCFGLRVELISRRPSSCGVNPCVRMPDGRPLAIREWMTRPDANLTSGGHAGPPDLRIPPGRRVHRARERPAEPLGQPPEP